MRDSEFSGTLDDIYEKTGVEVYLTPRGGEETSFLLERGGVKTEVFMAGTGEDAARVARLVGYILSAHTETVPDKREALRGLLTGGGAGQAERFLTRFSLSDAPCFALELLPEKRLHEAYEHILGCLEGADMAVVIEDRIAIVKFIEEGQNAFEYGQFLSQSLYEETGIRASVGIGCEMKRFSDISTSYHQAAAAVRMSAVFHGRNEVHSYREYLLVRLLEDLPRSKLEEYIEQFRISGAEAILGDEVMESTAEEFLQTSLNVSETSRNLYMHRNTLLYRLEKIENATGLNLRKFSDAVTFRIITIVYKLLNA